VVALGEAAQPDDVAVVEAGQQLQLQVEGVRPSGSLSLAVVVVAAAPDDGGDEAAGEARPVRRAAWSAVAALEHRCEAARGGLHLLGREPPEERQRTCIGRGSIFVRAWAWMIDSVSRRAPSRADGGPEKE